MYIGIDLGGTNIAVGIVDGEGKILSKTSSPTCSRRSFEEVVKTMADTCFEALSRGGYTEKDIEAIGIGAPGTINNKNGTVMFASNLGWTDVPLTAELQKYINIPVNIENDANAAAYGEYMMCGADVKDFIFITLGTGIGGGIIINGEIYRGFNGAGAEIGHNSFIFGGERCNCGKRGCWEVYGSVSGLIKQTKRAIEENPNSIMAKAEKIDGRTAFDAAKQGDKAAAKVVSRYIEYVADGICSIVNIFEPEVLLIGGGISKEGDYLLDPIKEYCRNNYYCKHIEQTELGIATLGNDAGIIGAALAAKNFK